MPLPATFVPGFHDEASCAQMEYRPFGRTGLNVSKISFGGGTLSKFYGELDEAEAIAAVHKALKEGINYFDTAPYYGQGNSERVLGAALKGMPRQAFYVATKVGRYELDFPSMFDYSAKKTRQSVEKSLQLLGVECLDVVQIHDIEFAPNLDVVINECLTELEKLRAEGKIRFIGVSAYPMQILKDFLEKVPGRVDTVLCYARYTLLDSSLLEFLPFFQSQNLGIVCASGHALGLLTNNGPQEWHVAGDEIRSMCRRAGDICRSAGVELGKLAMHYCVQLEGPATFLTGMQTRHLLDINLASYRVGLTDKEQEVLRSLKETLFTKSTDWEGIELERYWSFMNGKHKCN